MLFTILLLRTTILLFFLLSNLLWAAGQQEVTADSNQKASIHPSGKELVRTIFPGSIFLPAPETKTIFKKSIPGSSSIELMRDRLRAFSSTLSTNKQLLSPLLPAHPFQLVSMNAGIKTLYDSSYLQQGAYAGWRELSADAAIAIAGIPVSAFFLDQTWGPNNYHKNISSFRFDPAAYISGLKKKLSGKFDPASLLGDEKNPAEYLLQEARQSLKKDLQKINEAARGMLAKEIGEINNLTELFAVGLPELKQQLLNSKFIKSVQEKERLLSQLQDQIQH